MTGLGRARQGHKRVHDRGTLLRQTCTEAKNKKIKKTPGNWGVKPLVEEEQKLEV